MPKFEYVMSGCGYTKFFTNEFKDPHIVDIYRHYYDKVNKNGLFSMLFNAYTEPKYGPFMREHYSDVITDIHSDSGGLQMITQGKRITESAKDGIYKFQGEVSDVAMSFDEIPVVSSVEKAKIGVTEFRRFDKDNLDDYASRSGKNLLRQIEVFEEMGTSARPLLIVQGNCIDTFKQWTDTLLKEVPSSKQDKIGGISISAASHGSGLLEAIERAFAIQALGIDFNNTFHLLGVGGIRNLLPYVSLVHSGVLNEDIHISYDSTTHSSNLARRKVTKINGKNIQPGRLYNRDWLRTYEEVIKQNPEVKDVADTAEKYYSILNHKKNFSTEEYTWGTIGLLATSIMNLQDSLKYTLKSDKRMLKTAGSLGMGTLCQNLLGLRDYNDFEQWKVKYGSSYDSDKVKVLESNNSLESFWA